MTMIDNIRHFESWCYTRRNIAGCEWEIAEPQLLFMLLHWCGQCLSGYCCCIQYPRYQENTGHCQGFEVAVPRLEREGASGINEIYTWREDSSKRAESSKALNFPINQQQFGLRQNPNTGFTGIAAPLGKIVRGGKKNPRQLFSSNQNGINLQLFQYMECWTYLQRQRVHILQMN